MPPQQEPAALILMYFVLPLWLAAGFADWLRHRASHIETTTGAKESLIHLLMFTEVGVPLIMAIFLEVDALVIAVMIAAFFLHEATALWDLRYAVTAREVTPTEQHVHDDLVGIPLLAIVCVVSLHWPQFLAMLGLGSERARFDLVWKAEPLPASHVAAILVCVLLFEFAPYVEETVRGVWANAGDIVPVRARRAEIEPPDARPS